MQKSEEEKVVLAKEIVSCVERGLAKYGESVAQVIFYNFEKNYGLNKEEIVHHPEKFESSLEGIFGEGARVVKFSILQELANRFRIGKSQGLSFSEFIKRILRSAI